MSNKKLIIFDRDGTLNYDCNSYTHRITDCRLFEDVYQLFSAIDAKINICVATNQSGIGRGYYREEDMHNFNAKINSLISERTGHIGIKKFFFCPHLPSDNCLCRKPNSLLVLKSLSLFKCKPEESILVGDKYSDCLAAVNVGVQSFLLERSNNTNKNHLNLDASVTLINSLTDLPFSQLVC